MTALAGLFPLALAAYVCLLGPGQAWWRGDASGVSRLFARVALSAAWTTALGLALAALEAFSLPRVAVINGVVTLLGYVFVSRVRRERLPAGPAPRTGLLVAVAALCLYWPPYETHFAASDSTAYLASGVHLARSHRLWKHDPLTEELTPLLRRKLFFSVLNSPHKPPYARMPGGMAIATPDSDVVRPTFFPAPVVWSALSSDALGARYAGAYAPVFAALAVWATYLFARRRLGLAASLGATALVAANAASYWSGRFALAEPLTWFFLWAGLVALDGYEQDGFNADGRLAGLLLGAAALARIEYGAFLAAALAARRLLSASLGSRPLGPGFLVAFGAGIVAALLQVRMLPGAYVTPIVDTVWGLEFRLTVAASQHPFLAATVAISVLAAVAVAIRKLGWLRAILAAGLASFVGAYLASGAEAHTLRSLGWLSAYLGPATLVLAAAGGAVLWRSRHETGGDGFFLVLAALTSALLVYNPHVLPLLPWASRRFVPLLVPAVLLLASVAAVRLSMRSLLASAAALAILAAGVLWPARALWSRPFYEGTYERLAELTERLPKEGTLLIDHRLNTFVLGAPLWLAYGVESLPVDASSPAGRQAIAAVVYSVDHLGPIHLLKPSAAPAEPIPFVVPRRVLDGELLVALPEQTSGPPPHVVEEHYELISLFELSRWPRRANPAP